MTTVNKHLSADLRSYAKLTFKTDNNTFQIVNAQNPGSKADWALTPKKSIPGQSGIASATILGVSTAKNLSNSSGVFSIDLSPRIIKSQNINLGTTYLPAIIKPFTLVQIDFKVDDSGYHTEMIGFVTRATVKTTIQDDGTPARVFHIEGCDMTRAMQTYMMYFNPYVYQAGQYNLNGLLYSQSKEGRKIFGPRNPRDFVLEFLNIALNGVSGTGAGQAQPYFGFYFNPVFRGFANPAQQYVQSGIRVDSLIDFKSAISTEFVNMQMTDPFIILEMAAGGQKSLWDIMKSYSDPPFHEAFIDLRRPTSSNVPGPNGAPNLYDPAVQSAERSHNLANIKSTNLNSVNSTSQSNPQTLDTSSQQPYMYYMRTSPFSSKNWYNLNVHYFSTADILASDVSTSEENIFNYYEVICERENVMPDKYQLWALSSKDSNINYSFPGTSIPRIPIFDYQSILTYGLRKFPSAVTKYVDFVNNNSLSNQPSVGDTNKSIVAQATLIRELFRWFSFGEDFESGTITLKGRIGIGPWGMTMGSRLVELHPGRGSVQPTGKEYYIESVAQAFELGKPLITTMGVTRGHYPADYTDKLTGSRMIGRFNKVRQMERFMKLDQNSDPNQQLFYNIPE